MKDHVIKVPDLGEGVTEVELVAWHVKPGDTVAEDQPLADVMTDKASVEIPSPTAGTVRSLGGAVGQVLAVGAELMRIGTSGASEPAPAPAPAPTHRERTPLAAPLAAPPPAAAPAHTRPIASPAVRARAWEMGIDLGSVAGSGPAGRIVHADLDAQPARTATPPSPAAPASAGATHEIRIVGLRRRIALKMQEAKRRIPHFSYVEECDVGELEALRARLNAQPSGQRAHLTLLPFLIRALVLALREHPNLNARFDDEAGVLSVHDAVHLGIATQTDAGLMVPVLRDARAHDLWSSAREVTRLAEGARGGTLTRAELSGSTITLTSLGKLGGIASTPIINHPEVAIVGVNRIVVRPVVRDAVIVARPLMNLSSSFDHRVVDGARAAAFVQSLRRLLEHPALLFIE